MLKKIISFVMLVSLCLLVLLLTTTTPTTAGPFGLLAIFLTAYLACLGLISFFLYGTSYIIAHFSQGITVKKPIKQLSFRRSYYYSTILAAAPIMLIGLQSVGAVGIYEVVLIVLFVTIGCVYITKRIY